MAASTFRDWQQPFCPFDAIGIVRPTPSAPDQVCFAKTVRIARFLTDPARILAFDASTNALPYTREQVDQAVKYFSQQQHDETVDSLAWDWAYQEHLVFQHGSKYTRTWAPERMRWENVVLAEPIIVDLHFDKSMVVERDHEELVDHTEADVAIFEDDTTPVQSLSRCRIHDDMGDDENEDNDDDEDYDKHCQADNSATGRPESDPATPARFSLRSRHPPLILQTRNSLILGNQPSPVLGVSPRRSQSSPPQGDANMLNSDIEDEDNDDSQSTQNLLRAQFTRESPVPSPVKSDITLQNRGLDNVKNKRNHKRIHKTGIVLGFHRRQLQRLGRAQTANHPDRDYRQVVHGVVDALGRVQRWLRPTNMAGKLVPEAYRLKGVSGIDGESIEYMAPFKGMTHEDINDEVMRLTVEAKEKERFGGMDGST